MTNDTFSRLAAWPFAAILAAVAFGSADTAIAEECNEIHEIEITHVFEPGDAYGKPGDCFHFTNVHMIEHSAVGLDREFNTGILMPNGTAWLRFDEPIVIPYVCGVHPLMTGVLVVEEDE